MCARPRPPVAPGLRWLRQPLTRPRSRLALHGAITWPLCAAHGRPPAAAASPRWPGSHPRRGKRTPTAGRAPTCVVLRWIFPWKGLSTHTQMRPLRHTHTTRAHERTHKHACAYVCSHIHTSTHVHMCEHTQTRVHTLHTVHTNLCTHVRARTWTCTYTLTHTRTHTDTNWSVTN